MGGSTPLPTPVPSLKPGVGTRWNIVYTDSGPAKPGRPARDHPKNDARASTEKSRLLVGEEYRVGSGVAHVLKKFSDGSSSEIYIVHAVAYQADGGTKKIRAEAVNPASGDDVRFADVYPGCGWVKPECFVGTEYQGDRRLLHFKQPPAAAQPPDPAAGKGLPGGVAASTTLECEAWIDPEAALPVAFRQGTLHASYGPTQPLTDPIILPPEIELAVKRYNGYR